MKKYYIVTTCAYTCKKTKNFYYYEGETEELKKYIYDNIKTAIKKYNEIKLESKEEKNNRYDSYKELLEIEIKEDENIKDEKILENIFNNENYKIIKSKYTFLDYE